MAYKVFISHSTSDTGLVISLANLLLKFGVKVFVAEWCFTPDESIDKKIFSQIDKSDCVIVLLTQNGIRSNWLQQEVKYALNKKLIIPLIEKGIDKKELGALEGRKYIEYDSCQPQQALIEASTYIKSLKLRKKEQESALLIAGGILAFILLLSGGEK